MPPEAGVGVVIVAAGQGVRAGGTDPKQYRAVGGVPVLLRAIRPFARHPDVAQTVVVLPAADVAAPPAWLQDLAGPRLLLAPGGSERSDSVAAGLARLSGELTTVLVHDAARPFVSRSIIDAVIAAARSGVGAVPAVPVGDTLKELAERGERIQRTVARERLWRAQTPQGFPRALLERAHAAARAEGVRLTDDAMAVERIGGEVRVVPGSERNIKITTADDFVLAELIATLDPDGTRVGEQR